MATRTLAELRSEIRLRADQPSTDFLPDVDLTRMINQSARRLRNLIAQAAGQEYFATSAAAVTVAGVATVALPADFSRLLGVDVDLGGGSKTTLRPFNFSDRNRSAGRPGWSLFETSRYRVMGSNLRFEPVPDAAYNLTIWYVPGHTLLTAADDTLEGFDGWEEYVVVDCCAKILEKEESDSLPFVARKAEIEAEIRGLAAQRDQSFPEVIRDVSRIGVDDEG